MTNKEIILNFKNTFVKNMKSYSDYNDSLFKVVFDYDKWKNNLIERSKAIREMFKENEDNISLLRNVLNNLDDESAELLTSIMREFNATNIHDASIMIEIINKLIDYYENKDELDYVKLIGLNLVGALEEMEFFLRMDSNININNPLNKYMKVLSYKNHYSEIDNLEARRGFFLAYYNLIGPLPDLVPELRKNVLKLYKDAISFYKSDIVQSIDKRSRKIKDEIHYLNDTLITGINYYLNMDDNTIDEYFKTIEEILKYEDIEEEQLYLIRLFKSYHIKELSLDNMVDELYSLFFKYYGDKLVYDGTDDNLNTYCNCSDIAGFIFDLLKKNEFDNKKKYEYITKIGYSLLDYIESVPYKDFTSYFDDISADLFKSLLPFCNTLEQKDSLLSTLILRRQPITYIHSIMVEKITMVIASRMVKDKSFFNDLRNIGYDTDEKILDYLSHASFYHDLGKCLTLGVINLQNRKLTDEEFNYIKMHPAKSIVLLDNDKSFSEYYDVMLGHHKYYDGSGGYPIEFDNVNSKYRSAIDLVSIADSIDAATDILGRNYATGKSFDALLDELIDSKGIRYNPDMVDFISNDKELIEILNSITGENRAEVYFDVYQKILKEKK